MTGSALAVALVMAVALALGLVVFFLGREVRRLRIEVEALGRQRPPLLAEKPGDIGPAQPLARDDVVISPTPIGRSDIEPDLGVARVASVTLSGPLIKVAAFSHGVRRALDEETRMRAAYAFRKELRRQRRVRGKRAAARAAGPPRDGGWHP